MLSIPLIPVGPYLPLYRPGKLTHGLPLAGTDTRARNISQNCLFHTNSKKLARVSLLDCLLFFFLRLVFFVSRKLTKSEGPSPQTFFVSISAFTPVKSPFCPRPSPLLGFTLLRNSHPTVPPSVSSIWAQIEVGSFYPPNPNSLLQ